MTHLSIRISTVHGCLTCMVVPAYSHRVCPGVWHVIVKGGSGRVHEVLGGPLARTCDCPDFVYRQRGRCKHTEWVAALEALGRTDDVPFESSGYELFDGDELPIQSASVQGAPMRVDCALTRLFD